MGRILGLAKRAWIPLVLVVVLAVSALIVSRLHRIFGSEDLNANAGASIKIVQVKLKKVVYEVWGSPGSTANINYWDADANIHQVNSATLPWRTDFSTTLPSVSANIMAQGDGSEIRCNITIDDMPRDLNGSDGVNPNESAGHNPQTFCLVKSA